jgi:hypothetical protein
MTGEETYIAGSCNISLPEITQRKRFGYIGLVITGIGIILYLFAVFNMNLDPLFGILLSFPAFMSSIGFIQARQKFCAAYGLGKRYNVSSNLGVTINVENKELQIKDRNKAFWIIIQSIIISLIIAFIVIIGGITLVSF